MKQILVTPLVLLLLTVFSVSYGQQKTEKIPPVKESKKAQISRLKTELKFARDTIKLLRAEIPVAAIVAVEAYKLREEQRLEQERYSPKSMGLSDANFSPFNVPVHQLNAEGIKDFSNETSFSNMPLHIANYLGMTWNVSGIGARLEDPNLLNNLFTSMKPVLKSAIAKCGMTEKVKYWATEMLPYFTLQTDKAQRKFFETYNNKHNNDHWFKFNEDDWQNAVLALKVNDAVLQENYKRWLFVNRHYYSAEKKQKGSGTVLLRTCANILSFLKEA